MLFAKDTKLRSSNVGFDPICLMSNSLEYAYIKEKKLTVSFFLSLLLSFFILYEKTGPARLRDV